MALVQSRLVLNQILEEKQKEFEEFGVDKYSNQKLSALFTQLKNELKIEKIQDKKKSYFKASV